MSFWSWLSWAMTMNIEVNPSPARWGHWQELMLESHAEEGKSQTEVVHGGHCHHKPHHMLPKWVMATQLDYSLFFQHVPHSLVFDVWAFSSIFSNFSLLNFQPFYKIQLKSLTLITASLIYLLHFPPEVISSFQISLYLYFSFGTYPKVCVVANLPLVS